MKKLIEDVSILTNIPEHVLKKLVLTSCYSVSNAIYEKLCEGENECVIDIGIGELQIYIGSSSIKYKFIPSDMLEEQLIQAVSNKVSPLTVSLDNSLREKIEKSYKELI